MTVTRIGLAKVFLISPRLELQLWLQTVPPVPSLFANQLPEQRDAGLERIFFSNCKFIWVRINKLDCLLECPVTC